MHPAQAPPADAPPWESARAIENLTPAECRRFAELVAEAYPELHRVVAGLVTNPHDLDDVLQDAILKIFRNFRKYNPERGFRGWACTIALNAARDFLRAQRVRRGFGLSDELIQQLMSVSGGTYELAELRIELLHGCLAALSKGDQQMLWECYGTDVAAAEWARRRGKRENAVYSRLRRLRERLFDCINDKLGESS
ncbi:MAG: sigma-70 family RNA polymerase sigma factor [Planctomycetota bacterium]